MAEPERDDLLPGSGEDVVAAMNAWKDLPAAHLKVALSFWNERMAADHELRMTRERNRNRLDVMGMVAAFVISISSVGSAIVFGAIENYLMAGVMLGPSVFAIMKLFITRKADKADLKASGAALNVISQPGGPPLIP
ncbi:hypothetical protein [Streptomyces prunicolor]|uniref:Integral membrane protein n=1 Tax=Streptomyces prunicolor TaxID=67348 RepID=A0ABU4F3R2_9ACTN|nr:hypothetical protein [Streptomyces prunicolor]MDV7215221.1 hypothetical protein [Streptomyces prunicolor]